MAERTKAASGRLKRVGVEALTITRRRAGKGFSYVEAGGGRVSDPATPARICSLAIPPAYREVRVPEPGNAARRHGLVRRKTGALPRKRDSLTSFGIPC
jgi:DNA topoisomerase IB